jgi:hypothetical protein
MNLTRYATCLKITSPDHCDSDDVFDTLEDVADIVGLRLIEQLDDNNTLWAIVFTAQEDPDTELASMLEQTDDSIETWEERTDRLLVLDEQSHEAALDMVVAQVEALDSDSSDDDEDEVA